MSDPGPNVQIMQWQINVYKKKKSSFHKPIHSKVVTMEVIRKGVKIGDQMVYDLKKLFARLLVICEKRNITLESVLCYELSPIPPSLFDAYGLMRKSNKSYLATKLMIHDSSIESPDVQLIDGNELIYHTSWPKTGTVASFLQNFEVAAKHNSAIPVYVIFDKYEES